MTEADDAFQGRLRRLKGLHDQIAGLFKSYEQIKDRIANDDALVGQWQSNDTDDLGAEPGDPDDTGGLNGKDILGLDALVANEFRYTLRMLLDALAAWHGMTASGRPDATAALAHLGKAEYQLQIAFHDIIDTTDRFFRLVFYHTVSNCDRDLLIDYFGEERLTAFSVLAARVSAAIADSRENRDRRDDIYFQLAHTDAVELMSACIEVMDALPEIRQLQAARRMNRSIWKTAGLAALLAFCVGVVAAVLVLKA